MKHLQRQAKQRLSAFLLRHGKRYGGKSNWTQAHYRWMEEVTFARAVQQIVFQEYVDMVKAMTDRVVMPFANSWIITMLNVIIKGLAIG